MTAISWRRRVEYASGYLELGMLRDAATELAHVAPDDRHRPEVLGVSCDLYSSTKNWSAMADAGRALAAVQPDDPHGWISWAFALRELQQIGEARDVLLTAEARHPKCGTLHYNLGCYSCLLGDLDEAQRRLQRALAIDRAWKDAALGDPDLARLHELIAKL